VKKSKGNIKGTLSALNIPEEDSIVLLTGVNMENLAIRNDKFKRF